MNPKEPLQIECSFDSSFVLYKSSKDSKCGTELYSWGSTNNGILGHSLAELGGAKAVNEPLQVKFDAKKKRGLRFKQISAGECHAAILTEDNRAFFWGANSYGQLGLNDAEDRDQPTPNATLETLAVTSISCGNGFTFITTGQNEIMVSGKLPFSIQDQSTSMSMGGDQTDFITTF